MLRAAVPKCATMEPAAGTALNGACAKVAKAIVLWRARVV